MAFSRLARTARCALPSFRSLAIVKAARAAKSTPALARSQKQISDRACLIGQTPPNLTLRRAKWDHWVPATIFVFQARAGRCTPTCPPTAHLDSIQPRRRADHASQKRHRNQSPWMTCRLRLSRHANWARLRTPAMSALRPSAPAWTLRGILSELSTPGQPARCSTRLRGQGRRGGRARKHSAFRRRANSPGANRWGRDSPATTVHSPQIPPDRIFQHYQVFIRPDGSLWELGHGAMGVTYKALDLNLRCPVALKVINSDIMHRSHARERFVREARAAAKLRHPISPASFISANVERTISTRWTHRRRDGRRPGSTLRSARLRAGPGDHRPGRRRARRRAQARTSPS